MLSSTRVPKILFTIIQINLLIGFLQAVVAQEDQYYEPTRDAFDFIMNVLYPFLIVSFVLEIESKYLCFLDDMIFFFFPWFFNVFIRTYSFGIENFTKLVFGDETAHWFKVTVISSIIFGQIFILVLYFEFKRNFKHISESYGPEIIMTTTILSYVITFL